MAKIILSVLSALCAFDASNLYNIKLGAVKPYSLSYWISNSETKFNSLVEFFSKGKLLGKVNLPAGKSAFDSGMRSKRDISALPSLPDPIKARVLAFLSYRVIEGESTSLEGRVSRAFLYALSSELSVDLIKVNIGQYSQTLSPMTLSQFYDEVVKAGLTLKEGRERAPEVNPSEVQWGDVKSAPKSTNKRAPKSAPKSAPESELI